MLDPQRIESNRFGTRSTLTALLARPRLWLVAAACAALLTVPSLWGGLRADDLWHRYHLLVLHRSPFSLFFFLTGDVERNRALMDLGGLPWWTTPDLRLSFFRPITGLTHGIDYLLWPDTPALMHAHSLLWFVMGVIVTAWVYRRFLEYAWPAGLAAILFALDDAHAMPASWIANRNILPAFVFGMLTLIAHDRWRREGWRAGAVVGPLLLAASLGSGEAGAATVAYLLAHVVFLDTQPWRRRVLAFVPYAAVLVTWQVVHDALRCGAWGSAFYTDPRNEPLQFAAEVLERGPILLLRQWAIAPPDFISFLSGKGTDYTLWTVAVGFLLVASAFLVPVVRRNAVARFWTAGMLLSLVPICATFPMDRLLMFVGVGAFGLLAQFVQFVVEKPHPPATRRAWRRPAVVLCAVWCLIHLVISPISLMLRIQGAIRHASMFDVTNKFDPSIAEKSLIIVNSPSAFSAAFTQVTRVLSGEPSPRHVRVLAPSGATVSLARTDERTLVLRPDGGYLFRPFDQLYRGVQHPLALHERVQLTGVTVEITALTDDGRPAEAAFRFDVPLEDPSHYWLQWTKGAYRPFTPPAVGDTVRLRLVMDVMTLLAESRPEE